MVAETIPQAPDGADQLLATLSAALDKRNSRVQVFQDYYDGKQRLAFATPKFRSAFGNLFGAFADNFCDLIVDAAEERLDVTGFRVGPGEPGPGLHQVVGADPEGDKAAWAMWQANQLDLFSQIAHRDALVKETSYALVEPAVGTAQPLITVEDPCAAIVVYEAGSYTVRRAGLKRWLDDDGYMNATLYLPDWVVKYISRETVKTDSGSWGSESVRWVPREVRGEAWPLPNRLKVVPLVPLVNRPSLGAVGQSDLVSAVPIQNAINKSVMDMLVGSEFYAYPRRWATGIGLETDDETGQTKEPFNAAGDRVWVSENEGAKFGTLEAGTLESFVSEIELLIRHLASKTRTPYHYFMQHGGQPPSGDSLKASESGLVSKVERKQRYFGEGWEEVIRLGFLASGDSKRAAATGSETIWKNPERQSLAELADSIVKMQSVGVPQEQLWADFGYSPQQIARFLEMRSREAPVEITKPVPTNVPEMATGPAKLSIVGPDGKTTTITRSAAAS